mmetsp:Transcript_106235/g.193379  ORF Transcript_106235/g.193379 Transcript_106235/m.193379 type:complete len:130 (-) Transcript_106235:69-458(-)
MAARQERRCHAALIVASALALASVPLAAAVEAPECEDGCSCEDSTCGCNDGFCKKKIDGTCHPCPCFEAPIIPNGIYLDNCLGTKSGEVCDIECAEGFTLDSMPTRCVAGRWMTVTECQEEQDPHVGEL